MESTLIITVKSPSPAHTEKLLWMLGDDAPVFDDEVEPEWQDMFNALEDLVPPDVLKINDEYILFNWTCGYWDEALDENSSLLTKAGFPQQAAYYWMDEDEGYLVINGNQCSKAKPHTSEKAQLIVSEIEQEWGGEEDKEMIANLLSLFITEVASSEIH